MTESGLIGPPLGTTPAGSGRTRGYPREFPTDLLREASQRLAIISLVGAVLWVIGPLMARVALWSMAPDDPRWRSPHPTDAIAGASILLSLALFFYARRSDRDPRFILDLGLGYMILAAAAVGLVMHWEPPPAGFPMVPVISWIGAVVLMFAAIVPSTPGKTLVAGLIAASMNPLGMLIAKARGTWDFGSAGNAFLMHYPDYVLVGIAVVISHVVTRLGQQVAKAREMGSYQLGDLLGRGGMGEVYKATHRMLARPAAIKLIRPEMLAALSGESAQLAVRRFRREAEAAANLRSPHTVELYDFGVTDDQTFYFVMELLDGMDLESLVRTHGPVPASRVIHILRQVCESLAEAHASGLVHRDIKPANIHVGRLGLTHDFVKVLDFGLVKSVAGPAREDTLGTAAGLTPGTPAYMAPEMALGDEVDGRADLYALGCVAYFLLTGQVVFEGDNALQMVAKHLREAPVPPSRRTSLPVPPALEALVLACLAKAPDDRPRSAAELGRALADIQTEAWGEEQASRWWSGIRQSGAVTAASGISA
ncbi:MAG TPA: serine/threonine-protein kinase [Gemmatimonadales bacterium]